MNDGTVDGNTVTVSITVTPQNDAPVAVADSYTVNEGATLSIAAPGLLGNDSDADGDAITAIKVSDPTNGTLTLNANGSFTYVHDGSETTSDSYTYKVNDGTVDGNTVTVSITVNDITAPSVAIQGTPTTVNSTTAYNVTIQFSEDVTGFVLGDITVGNGSASNFVAVDGNTYTADITPSGVGNITIDVASSVAKDIASNDNTAAVQAVTIYDATAPSVVIQGVPATVSSLSAYTVTIQFSEDVTGFALGDITVGNGSAGNFVSVDGNTYTADITPTGVGNITIDVAAAVAKDAASNDNTAAVQAVTIYPIGFTLSKATATTSENGTTDNFTVVLTAQPNTDVVISITSGDLTEGTVSPATLTFTNANWNVAQTVTVTGVNDFVIDGNTTYNVSVAVNAAASDNSFDLLAAQTVAVTNTDDDTAGIILSLISGPTTEAGGTATFTIVLNTQPSADVTILLSSNDATEGSVGPGSVTFTSVNWNVPQTITVTGQNDFLIDGNVNYLIVTSAALSADVNYNNLDASDVSVVNTDDDTADFTISKTTAATSETGSTDNFTVVLNAQPATDVVISVISGDPTEGAVSSSSLTFTSGNWNTPQTVTITGLADNIIDGTISYNVILSIVDLSSDDNFDALPDKTVAVTNSDNNRADFIITPISGTTSEAGATADFSVTLTSQPSGNVTIPVRSSDITEGTLSTSFVVFTPATWNVTQTITVTGVDDYQIDGNVNYMVITEAASSSDMNYSNLNPMDLPVVNLDNDVAGFTLSKTTAQTSEAGTTDIFTVVLKAQPNSDVVISVTSLDLTEGTVSPAIITFTSANWNIPQNVTVKGLDDKTIDGDISYNVVLSVVDASSDNDFDAVDDQVVSVINIDNKAPIANNDTPVTSEEVATSFNVIANDTDSDGTIDVTSVDLDPLTGGTQVTMNTTEGSWSVNGSGLVTFVPVTDFVGAASITYTIKDNSEATSNSATITVTVTQVNDTPVAVADFVNVDEDGVLIGTSLLTNDTDVDGDMLAINTTPAIDVAHGSLTINSDGTFTYTPEAGYIGSDSFTYQVCDNGTPVKCATATVTINVIAVNDAPDAVADIATVNEDEVLNGTSLLANDTDVEGNTLSISTTPVSNPSHGTVTINSNGTYIYTPEANFNGTDSFTYQVCDNGVPSECSTGTVTITVVAVNDAPNAVADIVNVNEDGVLNGTSLLANDSDIDGDLLAINTTPVSGPLHGTVIINANGTYIYRPTADYNGSDTFTYQVCDNGVPSKCSNTTVTINVLPINDTPVAVVDITITEQDKVLNGASLLANDYDIDGDILTIKTTPVTNPQNGTVVINSDGTFTYTPNSGYIGNDLFTYEVCDNGTPSKCASATVNVMVLAINNVPVAGNDIATVNEDGVLNGASLLANDSDPDGDDVLTINTTPVSSTAHGSLTINADGTYNYIPEANYHGSDSFTYQVCDNGIPSRCATATVTITVVSVNDTPVAVDDAVIAIEDNVLSGSSLLVNDSDVDGDLLTINTNPVSGPSNGTLKINSDGTYIYTPNTNFYGTDQFTYEVCDNGVPNLCATATVTITVISNEDSDGDGIPNGIECPVASNCPDTDGDGIPDYLDPDSDNDGITDGVEGTNDGDGDGLPNYQDTDSDGDGIPDSVEGTTDTDGDGIPNYLDTDSDGDGIPDSVEGTGDTDGDGIPNYLDTDSDGDGIPDSVEGTGDADGDGIPNYLDTDSDGDGIPDSVEGTGDPDGDGIPNYLDTDSDGDGIPDSVEGTGDTDGDGIPNYLDTDSDGDGIPDSVEGTADTDGDGIPNYLDTDSDGDGIPDSVEGTTDTDGDGIPNYLDTDSDGDGIPDSEEGTTDTDGDGIPNYLDPDSDGDGIPDSEEGTDDTDGDGIPNYLDPDSDGDGIPDSEEGTGDTDGDGIPNYLDPDSDNDGISDEDEGETDADGDGIPDYLDPDSDGLLPNQIFTPNGDGQNDTFIINGIEAYPNNNLIIYNRWGNVVYEKAGYKNEWDGISNLRKVGSSSLPVGTYYYQLNYGAGKHKTGFIYLDR